MKGSALPVYQGGLMRCCLATLEKYNEEVLLDDVIKCEHCQNKMEVADSAKGPAWKWVQSDSK